MPIPVRPSPCDTTVSQLVNVCVPVTVKPFAMIGHTTTFCCGRPRIGTEPCVGEPEGICTFTVSQVICVEVPLSFGASVKKGETLVACGTADFGECKPE